MDHDMDHSMDHGMDMTTTMMHMTSTASAAMASGTGTHTAEGMDHSAHGGGGIGGGGEACKVSMLWNWDTIDACFITDSWQITSSGMFAGCCIGVICLVITLEALRRLGREYDAYILRRHNIHQQIKHTTTTTTPNDSTSSSPPPKPPTTTVTESPNRDLLSTLLGGGSRSDGLVRPTLFDQLVRATLHMMQFAVAYFAMLLAMYYNGYFIICIFIGAFIGSFIFAWEPLGAGAGTEIDACGVTKCCG